VLLNQVGQLSSPSIRRPNILRANFAQHLSDVDLIGRIRTIHSTCGVILGQDCSSHLSLTSTRLQKIHLLFVELL
jgi:hypothetical protein